MGTFLRHAEKVRIELPCRREHRNQGRRGSLFEHFFTLFPASLLDPPSDIIFIDLGTILGSILVPCRDPPESGKVPQALQNKAYFSKAWVEILVYILKMGPKMDPFGIRLDPFGIRLGPKWIHLGSAWGPLRKSLSERYLARLD